MLELQVTVAVPDAVRLLGAIEPQFSPMGIVSVRLTEPVNPLRKLTVIVELVRTETLTGVEEDAPMAKSVMVTGVVVV